MTERFKIVFSDPGAYRATMAIESLPRRVIADNPRRLALSIDLPGRALSKGQLRGIPRYALIVPEIQYELENGVDFDPFVLDRPEGPKDGDMEQVLDLINARDAWSRTKGAGVTIAVVDTGINGRRAEFTADRRHGGFASNDADAWDDDHGHGTMCAAIAAGSRDRGGEINGVAPMASLMSCRTTFGEVELSSIYDLLRERRLRGECIVATNSFGKRTGKPPVAETPNLFTDALQEATTAGVHTIFSAGNYHELAGGTPSGCEPTSIWLHKCLGSVCTVATCDQDRQMWHYSSRGPGQLHGVPGMGSKPDVTAPTPRNGEILFGSELRVMPHGWGTSGAAPQVAGLAALLLSLDKSLSSDMVFGYIRDTARSLGYAPACQGHGMIDCTAAIRRIH